MNWGDVLRGRRRRLYSSGHTAHGTGKDNSRQRAGASAALASSTSCHIFQSVEIVIAVKNRGTRGSDRRRSSNNSVYPGNTRSARFPGSAYRPLDFGAWGFVWRMGIGTTPSEYWRHAKSPGRRLAPRQRLSGERTSATDREAEGCETPSHLRVAAAIGLEAAAQE